VIEFTNSLLNEIDILLNLRVGDLIRLEYIKKMLLDNKPLYTSDRQYLENLIDKYIKNENQDSKNYDQIPFETNCWNCETPFPQSSNYCPSCGVKQNKQFSNNPFPKPGNQKFNPLSLVSNVYSYQILSIIGGLAALVPILVATSEINNVLDYFGFEDSPLTSILISAGVVSSLLSCFVMVIPLVIKNSKKVGRILFFAAFAILITSVLVGIVGFVFIMIASVIAFKKRRY